MNNEHLLQTLLEHYTAQKLYPMHMPGHKRRLAPAPGLPYRWDVTELPGTDNLHDAHDILEQAMQRTANLWGARRSWYLVNGSTCGILAGVRALAPLGSEVIAARNCHKSVYHAIELGALTAHWVTPPIDSSFGVYGSVPPQDIAAALEAHPAARCVILTSPTYEGVISDIAMIARICHDHNVPLLVDEAHGAHLGLYPGWEGGALAGGADVVVHSPHKTLPSMTQTALLHWNGDLADPDELARQLEVFETSSPSYPLLASLDGCTGLLQGRGRELFAAWAEWLNRFDRRAFDLRHLRVLCYGGDNCHNHPKFYRHDRSKLLISTRQTDWTAPQLATALREQCKFETEMTCGENVLAMSSPCDGAALDHFASALLALDRTVGIRPAADIVPLPQPGPARCTIAEALHQRDKFKVVPLNEAAGCVAAEYVWAYPPGVPLVAPGEQIPLAFTRACTDLGYIGTTLHHTGTKTPNTMRVLG
ncbi:MAG: PLP-dependent transferase [Gemmiger sp.]|nr:PLP-dependent transferase [Gemmiger sp.]